MAYDMMILKFPVCFKDSVFLCGEIKEEKIALIIRKTLVLVLS